MPAYEFAVEPQMAVFLTADNQLPTRNLEGLLRERATDDVNGACS